ncbi:methyltransferase [subsurface metagenome]
MKIKTMRKKELSYQEIYRLESSVWWKKYWWRQGRDFTAKLLLGKFLKPNKKNKILDVGCGLGETSRKLSVFGQVVGIDSSPEAIKLGLKRAIIMNINNLLFPKNSFDVVTAFDVLEHLENDQKAIKEVFKVLRNRGIFLLTVPSYNWLWSEHDEALGHKRRYTKSQIEKKLKSAGFTILKSSYIISTFLLPIALFRFWQKTFKKEKNLKTSYVILPPFLNFLLAQILRLEGVFLQAINLPFGVSLVCVVKKQ